MRILSAREVLRPQLWGMVSRETPRSCLLGQRLVNATTLPIQSINKIAKYCVYLILMALYDEMMGRCEKNVATLENRSAEPRVAFCHVDNTRISHGLHAMELC